MKSQTKCHTENGSLLFEVLLAITILSIFLVASMAMVHGARGMRPLLEDRAHEVSVLASQLSDLHDGNITLEELDPKLFNMVWFSDSLEKVVGPGNLSTTIFGGDVYDSCDDYFSDVGDITHPILLKYPSFIPSDVLITDIIARNGILYITTDSSVQARHDFYIYDTNSSSVISSLHTGPGLSAVALFGKYIYVANTSTTNQLQLIDISNRANPYVYSRFKLPLPEASTTPPHGSAIFYSNSHIYLGTDKWDGTEFSVIDMSNPGMPVFLGGFEVGSVVRDIIVSGKYAYISTAGEKQFMKLDISNPTMISEINSFTPQGWQIEEGSVMDSHHGDTWMSSVGGGFNTSSYKELFRINSNFVATSSVHIDGGVYGLAVQEPFIFLATGRNGGSFEVLNMNEGLSRSIDPISMISRPVAMACDRSNFYLPTEDGSINKITFINI